MAFDERVSEYLLELLRCAMNNSVPQKKPEAVTWSEIYKMATKHSVSALALYALRNAEEEVDPEVYMQWMEQYNKTLIKSSNQDYELSQICASFSEAGIAHMPLKGCCIRHLFAEPELREMSDLDILIHDADILQASRILESKGYKQGSDNGNHIVFTKLPYICIELHRDLIASNYEFYPVFQDPWQYGFAEDGSCRYEMRREDFYLYLLTHAAKHYYYCGTGIRSVIDVYLYLRAYGEELDQEYLENRIQIEQLRTFRAEIETLAFVWFGDRSFDAASVDEMAFYILNSATYGTKKGYEIRFVRQQMEKGKSVRCAKTAYFLHMTFLPLQEMKLSYPILEKVPLLLPFCWVARWLHILFCKPKNIGKRYQQARSIAVFEEEKEGR